MHCSRFKGQTLSSEAVAAKNCGLKTGIKLVCSSYLTKRVYYHKSSNYPLAPIESNTNCSLIPLLVIYLLIGVSFHTVG